MPAKLAPLTAEQQLIEDSAAQFFAARANAAPGNDGLADMGWLGWRVPAALGGSELGWQEGRLLHEAAGRARAVTAMAELAVLAVEALNAAEHKAVAAPALQAIATGTITVGHGLADAHDTLTATPQGLQGTLPFAGPPDAHAFIVRAGDALYLLPRDRDGLQVHTVQRLDGGQWATLHLNQAPVSDADCLSTQASRVLDAARCAAALAVAAELLGLMQGGFDSTMDHLRLRRQFDVPIGSFQALQHRAADLLLAIELARSAVMQAADLFDRPAASAEQRGAAASGALARCATTALDVLKAGVQLHGAIGYTDEADIGRRLKRAMVLAATLGTPAAHRQRHGAALRAPQVPAAPAPPAEHGDLAFDPQALRTWAETHYPPHLRQLGRRASWREAADWHQRLYRQGWAAPGWPKEFGGLGLSAYEQVLWSEQLDAAGVHVTPSIAIHMLGPLLIRHGSAAQQRRWLPGILSGETLWCQGYSEPGAGSDLAALRTSARLQGEHFIVNGQKTWTSLAHEADMMFLLARTDATARRQAGISCLLVDMKSPGITVTRIRNLAGHAEFCNVFFDDVKVPAEHLVGPLHGGWALAKSLLGSERVTLGSPRYLQRALARLRALAQAQGAFNDPVFSERFDRHALDAAHIAALYVRVVDALRRGEDITAETSLLKLATSEAWQRITEDTLQLAGPAALTGEAMADDALHLPEPLLPAADFLHARSATIYGGTSEVQRNIVARALIGLPRSTD